MHILLSIQDTRAFCFPYLPAKCPEIAAAQLRFREMTKRLLPGPGLPLVEPLVMTNTELLEYPLCTPTQLSIIPVQNSVMQTTQKFQIF